MSIDDDNAIKEEHVDELEPIRNQLKETCENLGLEWNVNIADPDRGGIWSSGSMASANIGQAIISLFWQLDREDQRFMLNTIMEDIEDTSGDSTIH